MKSKTTLSVTPRLLMAIAVLIYGCAPAPEQTTAGTQAPVEPTVSSEEPVAETTTEVPAPEPEMKSESSAVKETAADSDIPLELASWEQVQQKIAEQKGKVVVLDIWSSWCLPCVREFPGLVALQQKYPDQVVSISLNLNYDGRESHPPESYREEVLDFLKQKQARIINLISTTADETVYETIDLASIPVAYVYDAEGTLAKRFDNETNAYGDEGFTYKDHIEPFVAGLLSEKGE